ncbi:MAG: hypothetical protein A4E28_02577 [Methanocella sp. PtaU1.Bin125]|nr:MAG: hypothetical protein A4E28_02577 [Methanocella sp. PtaU1.Bin125]
MLLLSACFFIVARAQADVTIDDRLSSVVENYGVLAGTAIDNYLSGKADRFTVPGIAPGIGHVFPGHPPAGYAHPLPSGRPGQWSAAPDSVSTLSITGGETLPYSSGFSDRYAATYIGAGGVSSRTPSVLASSVYARVSSKSLINLQPDEIIALHLWGRPVNGYQPENDIIIGRNWSDARYVDFSIYISARSYPWMKTITCPASHNFYIYIRTVNPRGTSYSRLEFCVNDLTAMRSYTFQFTLPAAQTMDGADVALEKYYRDGEPRPGLVRQWRTVSAFHVYDQYNRCMDLLRSGYVCEWLTPGVQTAYYHDYRYYAGVSGGDGTFYMTRYRPGSTYPPHP